MLNHDPLVELVAGAAVHLFSTRRRPSRTKN